MTIFSLLGAYQLKISQKDISWSHRQSIALPRHFRFQSAPKQWPKVPLYLHQTRNCSVLYPKNTKNPVSEWKSVSRLVEKIRQRQTMRIGPRNERNEREREKKRPRVPYCTARYARWSGISTPFTFFWRFRCCDPLRVTRVKCNFCFLFLFFFVHVLSLFRWKCLYGRALGREVRVLMTFIIVWESRTIYTGIYIQAGFRMLWVWFDITGMCNFDFGFDAKCMYLGLCAER